MYIHWIFSLRTVAGTSTCIYIVSVAPADFSKNLEHNITINFIGGYRPLRSAFPLSINDIFTFEQVKNQIIYIFE